ncbi:MAG: 2-C-methyl-D-erythritol 2,4-cyclodiphosphate synthase [Tepidisphaera sp.]
MRIGHGYDLHRLEAGTAKPLILGGVRIPCDRGPVAHSDGDAVMHALTDALLGALGEPDIGQLFPDTAPENAGKDSAFFLAEAVRRVHARSLALVNADITVILERPKIGPHKAAIMSNLSKLLGGAPVNLKGKTHEGVDAVGRGEAVEVHAVVLLA